MECRRRRPPAINSARRDSRVGAATWNELNAEARALGATHDIVRRRYLRQLAERTGRNTVPLHSGWLDRPGHPGTSIGDTDKIGPMTVAAWLDPERGLDLLIRTSGGDMAATESITHYLRALRFRHPGDCTAARALGRHGPLLRDPRGPDGGAVEPRPDRSS